MNYKHGKPPATPLARETAWEYQVSDRQTVGVRELRQNLSVYLDQVKAGAVLTVTEHGHAVALLRPLDAGISPLDRLVAEGVATPPAHSLRNRPAPVAWDREKPLSETLIEMREEERY